MEPNQKQIMEDSNEVMSLIAKKTLGKPFKEEMLLVITLKGMIDAYIDQHVKANPNNAEVIEKIIGTQNEYYHKLNSNKRTIEEINQDIMNTIERFEKQNWKNLDKAEIKRSIINCNELISIYEKKAEDNDSKSASALAEQFKMIVLQLEAELKKL